MDSTFVLVETRVVHKAFIALGTGEWLLPRMGQFVPYHRGFKDKPFLTMSAGIRRLSGVQALVDYQVGILAVALAALLAHMRLLLCMDPRVLDHTRFPSEAFPTDRTRKRLLSGVDHLVKDEMGMVEEFAPTLCTGEGSFPGVDPLMGFHMVPGGKPFPAQVAWKALFPCVNLHVPGERCLVAESLPAQVARTCPPF